MRLQICRLSIYAEVPQGENVRGTLFHGFFAGGKAQAEGLERAESLKGLLTENDASKHTNQDFGYFCSNADYHERAESDFYQSNFEKGLQGHSSFGIAGPWG